MPNNLVYKLACRRPIKHYLERIPYVRRLYSGWSRIHPFDTAYGTDTSGYVPVEGITSDRSLRAQINPYAASQPGIVRRALAQLPDPQEYAFLDIGCGKGRVAFIASEFPFRQISGVDLSVELIGTARSNLAQVQAKYPNRSPISFVEGNALKHPLPSGKVVLFLCHSFGRELVGELIKTLENGLASSIEHLFFIYYNPVNGDMFDASPALDRWFAQVIPYDESEIGYGPDLEDAVVIWQSRRGALPNPRPGADRRIIIHKPLWTAGLAS